MESVSAPLEWYRWAREPAKPHDSKLANRDRLTIQGSWFADTAKAARGIVCSTPALAHRLSELNSNVVVIPNVLDPSLPAPQHPTDGTIRVGVPCSGFHAHDLELVIPALQTAARMPNVEVVLYGWHPGLETDLAAQQEIGGFYTNREFTYRFEPHMPFKHYCVTVGQFDIAMVPLFGEPHNGIKSNCKYLEFSRHGVPGVYARLEP